MAARSRGGPGRVDEERKVGSGGRAGPCGQQGVKGGWLRGRGCCGGGCLWVGVCTGTRCEGACFQVALREGQGGQEGAEGARWAQRPSFMAASGGQRGTNGPFSRRVESAHFLKIKILI